MPRSRRRQPVEPAVIGIGGIFLRSKNPGKLSKWYSRNLGLKITDNVALFVWRSGKPGKTKGHTVWSLFESNSKYFPVNKQVMVNYRVRDLDRILGKLRRSKVRIGRKIEDSQYGRFGWIYDPEGNMIELWQPPREYRFPEKANIME